MKSVRLRALAAAALALAPAAGLLVAAAPALAATSTLPTLKSVTTNETSFVLPYNGTCKAIIMTATLSAVMPTDGYQFSGVGADLFAPGESGDDSYDGIEFMQVGAGDNPVYRGSLSICGKYPPGAWHAEVYGAAVPTGATTGDDFVTTNQIRINISLKRPSRLTFNASPEPVKKGKKVTAAGTLKIDGKAYANLSVVIYFKASGAKTWTVKGTAKTTSKGAYSRKFVATKSGTWKAVYAGSSTRQAASKADAVAVK